MFLDKTLIQNTFNRILNTVVIFITTAFLSRVLGASDLGLLTLLIANATLLNLLFSFGINSGITYNLASKSLHGNKVFSIICIFLLIQLFLSSIFEIGWFQINKSFFLLDKSNLPDLLLGICFLISISVIEKYSSLFYGRQQFMFANNIVLVGNITLLFFLFILFFQKIESNYVFFVVYILAHLFQAITLIVTYHIVNRVPIVITSLNKEEIKLFFSYSFLAFITNILQFIAYRADYWLVEYFKGSAQLGLYSVSVRLAQLFWIIPNLIAAIIFPRVAGKLADGKEYHFLSIIRLMNTCNIAAGLFLLFFSPYLVILIFGIEYSNSVIPFQILLPGIISFCITTVLASYFAGINKLKVNFWGTLLCLLVIIILDLALIPGYGILGAAIASSIGYSITALYSMIVFKQMTQISFSQLLIVTKADLIYFKKLSIKYLKL